MEFTFDELIFLARITKKAKKELQEDIDVLAESEVARLALEVTVKQLEICDGIIKKLDRKLELERRLGQ